MLCSLCMSHIMSTNSRVQKVLEQLQSDESVSENTYEYGSDYEIDEDNSTIASFDYVSDSEKISEPLPNTPLKTTSGLKLRKATRNLTTEKQIVVMTLTMMNGVPQFKT